MTRNEVHLSPRVLSEQIHLSHVPFKDSLKAFTGDTSVPGCERLEIPITPGRVEGTGNDAAITSRRVSWSVHHSPARLPGPLGCTG